MAGAYVALPDADTTPDVPPGWGGWPFPGPYPPGYTPDLSMVLGAPPQMKPGTVVRNIASTLFDQGTFATNQPTGVVVYTAVWANPGATVELKLAGGGSFESSIREEYGDIGDDFWGITVEFEFNVSAADVGKTIILTATSTPFDGSATLVETKNILVVEQMAYTTRLTIVSSDPAFPVPVLPYSITWAWSVNAFVWDQDAGFGPYCETYMEKVVTAPGDLPGYSAYSIVNSNDPESEDGLLDFGTYMPEDDGDLWYLGASPNGTNIIQFLRLEEVQLYDISFQIGNSRLGGGSITYTMTLVVSMDGEDQETATKVLTIESVDFPASNSIGETIWCTLNGETGEITIINP